MHDNICCKYFIFSNMHKTISSVPFFNFFIYKYPLKTLLIIVEFSCSFFNILLFFQIFCSVIFIPDLYAFLMTSQEKMRKKILLPACAQPTAGKCFKN